MPPDDPLTEKEAVTATSILAWKRMNGTRKAALRVYEKAGFVDFGYVDPEVPDAVKKSTLFAKIFRQADPSVCHT